MDDSVEALFKAFFRPWGGKKKIYKEGKLSDETIVKIKIATLASIGVGLLAIAVSLMGLWVSTINAEVIAHGKDIAQLRQITIDINKNLAEISPAIKCLNADLSAIRERQEVHIGVSSVNQKLLKEHR